MPLNLSKKRKRVELELVEAVGQVGLILPCLYPPDGKWYEAEIREWDQTCDKYYVVYVEDNIGRWIKREQVRADDVNAEVPGVLQKEPQNDVNAEVPGVLQQEPQNDVNTEVPDVLQKEPQNDVNTEVPGVLQQEPQNDVNTEVPGVLQQEPQNDVDAEVPGVLQQEPQNDVNTEVPGVLQQEPQNDVNTEVPGVLQQEPQNDVDAEVSGELQKDPQNNVNAEVSGELQEEPHSSSISADFSEENFSDSDTNYEPPESSEYIDDSESETEYCDSFLPEKSLMTKVCSNTATTSSYDSDAMSEIIPVASCSVLTVSACDSTSSVRNIETSISPEEPIEACNTNLTSSTTDITIVCTDNSIHRKYDKYDFCYFCKHKRSNLSRHLVDKHSAEDEVQTFIKEKNKVKKNLELIRLRNLGNHLNNCKVLQEGRGQFIVKYRPTNQKSGSHNDYASCKYCYGYFAKKSLWKHKCSFFPTTNNAGRVRKMSQIQPLDKEFRNLSSLLTGMRLDNVGKIAISDSLILHYGSHLLTKLSGDKELYSYVRGKMRHLASLVNACRQIIGNSVGLSELLVPDQFDTILKAVTQTSGFDNYKHTYKVPSNAVKSGQVLHKAAELKMSKCAEKGETSEVEKCTLFLKVLNIRWTEISSSAMRNLNDRKRNVVQLLPLTEDVTKLNCHLNKLANALVETLKVSNDPQSFFELVQVLLTKLILFNRKRQGEVSKMLTMDWNSRSKANATSEILEDMSDLEKHLIQIMDRIEIRGKKGRTVAVLITTEIHDWMLRLMDHRSTYVAATNNCLFPNNSEDSHFRGSDTLRKYAVESSADKPHLLTTTRLRKHVASMAQVLCLRPNELDMLANFMGHDIRIHTNFYRKPLDVLQVARVAKVFLAAEQGQISQYSGKNLEEIEVGESIEEESKSDVDENDDDIVNFQNATQLPRNERRVFPVQLIDQTSDNHERKESNVSPVPQKRRKFNPVPWTAQEKQSVKNYFAAEIMSKTLPGKEKITEFLACERIDRPWRKIKDFLRNNYIK